PRHLELGLAKATRRFAGAHSTFTRLFEFEREQDADTLVEGVVPAIAATVQPIKGRVRTWAPMVQLWKLASNGVADLINIGMGCDSGRIADIRWTSQLFADLLIHDPYYAGAFLGVAGGQRLMQR